MNELFNNACGRIAQATPPIWFMRQAGRYHKHYQKLKEELKEKKKPNKKKRN